MPKPAPKLKEMPPLSRAEEAQRDAQAQRELAAGEGIPGDEVRSWLQARLDGKSAPMPKARKLR